MHEFFNSVGRSFARNQRAVPSFLIAVFVIFLGIVLFNLFTAMRRRKQDAQALEAHAQTLGLDLSDLALIGQVAKQAEVPPKEVMARLDVFEASTAAFFQACEPKQLHALSERVRKIRVTLGFDRLQPSLKLLSTRELTVGTEMALGGSVGTLIEIDELSFQLEFESAFPLTSGERVRLTVVNTKAAQYSCECTVVDVRPTPEGEHYRSTFSHDESPVRRQQREFLRVETHYARMTLRRSIDHVEIGATVVDLSGGGARVQTPVTLEGQKVRASFSVDGEAFSDVEAEVISSTATEGGFDTRLRFQHANERQQEQLISALMRLEVRHRTQTNRKS